MIFDIQTMTRKYDMIQNKHWKFTQLNFLSETKYMLYVGYIMWCMSMLTWYIILSIYLEGVVDYFGFNEYGVFCRFVFYWTR